MAVEAAQSVTAPIRIVCSNCHAVGGIEILRSKYHGQFLFCRCGHAGQLRYLEEKTDVEHG